MVRVKWTVEGGLWAEKKVFRIGEHSSNTFKEAPTKLLRAEDDRKQSLHILQKHPVREPLPPCGGEKKVR